MTDLKAANKARLDASLDKKWKDSTGGIYTLRERLAAGVYVAKAVHVTVTQADTSAIHKSLYKPARRKTEYALYYGEGHCTMVPKMVYDYAQLEEWPTVNCAA